MREQRLRVFRSAVDALIESLDAVVRLGSWSSSEPKPEPLVASASKLVDRLGAADRLSSTRFQGPPNEAERIELLCTTLKRLDLAYVAYRRQIDPVAGTASDAARAALETEIARAGTTVADASAWR